MMTIEQNKACDIVSYQLLKASSSVAANFRAACRGMSSADFLNKLKVVDEEATESLFWLEFINDLKLKCDNDELIFSLKESDELVRSFSVAIKTPKQKIPNPKSLILII